MVCTFYGDGICHYLIQSSENAKLSWWIIGLAIMCAGYAYYTLGLEKLTGISSLWFGLFGNGLVIILAAIVALKLYPTSPPASWLIVPVIVWTAFATLLVIGEMKAKTLI